MAEAWWQPGDRKATDDPGLRGTEENQEVFWAGARVDMGV